jgi:branched-chain amino acid transport system substrate-binding protein
VWIYIYITTFYKEGGSPEFDRAIKEWINGDDGARAGNGGGDKVAAVTAMGYDAYYVALEALQKAGSADPAAIKAHLPALSYTGVTGLIAFDVNGDALRDTAFVKKSNNETGEWELITQQGVK